MSKSLPLVNNASNDTLQSIWTKLNNILILANTEIVTANSSPNGAFTVGNGYVVGYFGANTIVASTIQGGNTVASGNVAINSNLTINAVVINSNASNIFLNSATLLINALTTHSQNNIFQLASGANGLVLTSNSTASNLQINVLNTSITGNTTFSNTVEFSNTVTIGNVVINANNISIGATVLNSSYFSGTSNNSTNFGGNPTTYYANGTSPVFSASVNVGSNVSITLSSLSVLNTISNSFMNAGEVFVGNSTVNSYINSSAIFLNGGIVNSTTFSGTSNNSTNFGGNPTTYYANVTSPVFSASVNVGSNVSITTTNLLIGNTTQNVVVNNSGFYLNGITIIANSLFASYGNSTVNSYINSTSLVIGSSIVNTYTISTGNGIFSGQVTAANLYINGGATVNGSLFINGNLVYSGVSSNNFIPSTTGQLLGNSTFRWNLSATDINVSNSVTITNTFTVSGQANIGGNLNVSSNISGLNISANSLILGQGNNTLVSINFNSNSTGTLLVDTFNAALYRSVSYFLSLTDNNSNSYHSSHILAVQDGTNTYQTEYAQIFSNQAVGTFSSNISSGGSFQLWYTPISSNNSTGKIFRTLFTV